MEMLDNIMTDLEKAVNRICPHCDSTDVVYTGNCDSTYTMVTLYYMCGSCEKSWRVNYDLEPSELILE
jgi:DNA-directed RNA polymerase subunit M/transcription elongation factor TFIIS